MSSPHILIIGGGLGGLALAQGLKKNGISFTLFERDPSPTVRAQGYRIRLTSGAEALRGYLDERLWDLFEATCAEMKSEGGARINAIDGSALATAGPPKFGPGGMKSNPGSDAKAYTVDRTMLRSLLLLGQENHVKFGKAFQRYELTPTGVTAFFDDGTSEDGTLLVGADGVTSPVRKQFLPAQRYVDGGSRVIYGKTPLTGALTAAFPKEALEWTTIVQDKRPLTLYLEPVRFPKDAFIESAGRLEHTDDYVYWVLGGNAEHIGLPDENFRSLSGVEAANLTLKLTESWKPAFRSLFELQHTDKTSPLRLLSAKPERPEWTPSTRVTLLGDAAHAMMPVGSGANAALTDAASLVMLIVEEGVSEDMMTKYVDRLWGNALPLISGSAMGAQKLLGFKGFEHAKEVDL